MAMGLANKVIESTGSAERISSQRRDRVRREFQNIKLSCAERPFSEALRLSVTVFAPGLAVCLTPARCGPWLSAVLSRVGLSRTWARNENAYTASTNAHNLPLLSARIYSTDHAQPNSFFIFATEISRIYQRAYFALAHISL